MSEREDGDGGRSRPLGAHHPRAFEADELLEEFIARRALLARLCDTIRGNARGQPQQHVLLVGARGLGKTTTLLAVAYTVERDAQLAREWIPLVLPEEAYYRFGDLADFWREADEQLGAALRVCEDAGRVDADEGWPESLPIEELEHFLRERFLARLDACGRRAILCVENLADVFRSLTDETAQHRLRAFLMDDERVMLLGSATTYFEDVASIDRPFFDFFRVHRLAPFDRDETFAVLRGFADARRDDEVRASIECHPERVDALRVLTGGNPRLVKLVYRVLREGDGDDDVMRDLERMLDDCTPYYKARIETLSGEQRRVFDRVARAWDPVAVKDLERDLRRPSNKISTYLRRLVDDGFVEEALGSQDKRKRYQVAERFANVWYLMRFAREGRRRLAWLVRFMQALYAREDAGVDVPRDGEAAGDGRASLEERIGGLARASRDAWTGVVCELLARAGRARTREGRAELVAFVEASGGGELLADLVLALRALDDPALLEDTSPERRAVARDVARRIDAGPSAQVADEGRTDG